MRVFLETECTSGYVIRVRDTINKKTYYIQEENGKRGVFVGNKVYYTYKMTETVHDAKILNTLKETNAMLKRIRREYPKKDFGMTYSGLEIKKSSTVELNKISQ